ncbi:prepilin-type N-terminal cleavage/methylation domain-containing protein [Vibrio sp. RE86]|uniref:prepilin-type N-terminal cleavage/methylation domain-containing protein n=1 Tax=Vibrio sp. RE86 TaxID=2607605 RepID=UPI001493DC36|nr:prepilin-type N-terminal cleavage/methylation domain-containing protein [Vibrio sp. RE86]NOH80911.1 prepilin-type N-terminal cleavage/methylation domain-containing protein [Vibrio sp. RE86]
MREKGFTLIELVVVIVILGTLAVVAAPRFLNMSQDAHESAANGIFSAFRSGLSLFEASCVMNGGDSVITGGQASDHLLVQIEGVTAAAIGTCYPASSGTPDGRTSDFADCLQIWEGVLSNSPSYNTSSITISDANLIEAAESFDVVVAYGSGWGQCDFYYVASRQGLNSPVLNYDSENGTLERQN